MHSWCLRPQAGSVWREPKRNITAVMPDGQISSVARTWSACDYVGVGRLLPGCPGLPSWPGERRGSGRELRGMAARMGVPPSIQLGRIAPYVLYDRRNIVFRGPS